MKKNKLSKIMLIIFITTLLLSCGKKKEVEEEAARPVKTQIIGNQNIILGYTGSAEIKGKEEIPYIATSQGAATLYDIKNGDFVTAGQVVVTIDNQVAKANVSAASSNYQAARINYEKYSMLYEKRLVTETEFLQAKTNFDNARASLHSANDGVSKTSIRTNVSGIISDLNVKNHQEVQPGQQLFTLVDDSEMEIELGVPAGSISKIKVGAEATVKIDEIQKEYKGRVSEVSETADATTRQFIVKVRIANPNREMKKGMYGVVSINTGIEQGVVIPKEAIVIRGIDKVIYTIIDGRAKAIVVKIINENEKYASVEGEGLFKGMEIITDGQNVVQNDEKIKKVN